jgi:hypothetical protein
LKDHTRRVLRTIFQSAVALAAAAPMLVGALGVNQETVPGVAIFLTVSAAVTRLMALPLIDSLLPSFLRKDA